MLSPFAGTTTCSTTTTSTSAAAVSSSSPSPLSYPWPSSACTFGGHVATAGGRLKRAQRACLLPRCRLVRPVWTQTPSAASRCTYTERQGPATRRRSAPYASVATWKGIRSRCCRVATTASIRSALMNGYGRRRTARSAGLRSSGHRWLRSRRPCLERERDLFLDICDIAYGKIWNSNPVFTAIRYVLPKTR